MSNTEYPKVEKELFNVDNENLQKLASLFPSAVKDGQLDIEALKEELGQFEEVGQEKYELNWAGKQNAKKEARKNVLGKTLRYIEGDGVNENTTQNLYIEGDNLEVLKLLRKNYYGSIKMIYIDPPYNTGNDFVYNDNFSISQEELEQIQGERDEYGERLQKNSKDSAKYHTNWLNMMYPRLQLAKDLLTDDGIVFISIDYNENYNLRKIADEIFGATGFVGEIYWESKTKSQNTSTSFDKLQPKVEMILVYAKKEKYRFNLIKKCEKDYPLSDEQGVYREYPLELMNSTGVRGRETMIYDITDGVSTVSPPTGKQWQLGQAQVAEYQNNGNLFIKDNKVIIKMRPEFERNETTEPFWGFFSKEIGTAESAKKELTNIIQKHNFETVKPIELIKRIIYHVSQNDTVLDFFSGSATTAHAVMQLNSEDNGNRKFILVQLPEVTDENSEARIAGFDNICEIGKERIRRAGQKIKDEIENGNQQLKLGEEPKKVPDIGFKVFRVGETTLNWEKLSLLGKDLAHDYLPNTSNKDRLDFTPDYQNDLNVVYEIMLRQEGLPLTSNIEKLTDIGSRTYLVADSYLISLEETITPEMIEKLSALNPLPFKFVFRDSAFDDDIVFKDETFRKLNALIDKNTNSEKKAYTVEFI
jgi:adenine-specific DNA-methyltransferase